ncbi:hypothetical protein L1S35_03695 [Flavobacterium sp. AS60]|uniref:hypothetical protein n=1 Tax=Flavobacterium anseongense TaxID=2910677 RepID=UPI001F19F2B4|nr:hypothetical protein [Flavobacterium sp. AS60]MCF6128760.1 hypothetical protein [Flavobacterium sp. AS60]
MEEKLSLNELAVAALRESAKWCLFLAIVGFIGIAFMVLAGAFMSLTMATIGNEFGGVDPLGGLKAYFGLIYIVIAALYFFPIYYLYKYATGTKRALESSNSEVLSDALVNLKSHHKFLGITTIVIISLYILIIIGVIIFAAKMASSGM